MVAGLIDQVVDHPCIKHSTVQMTLDRYGHLFPELDEKIAMGLDETFRTALAAAGTKAGVTAIDPRR